MSMLDGCRSAVATPLWRHPYVAGALTIAMMVVSVAAVRGLELPAAGRLAFGLLPVAAAAYLMWTMARWMRGLDELQQKIQAESLALAFTGAILISIALNFLDKAGFRLPLGWEDGLGILAFLYFAASLVTARRYQ